MIERSAIGPDAGAALSAQFERDAAPLSSGLHQRALRLTRNHHDAEDLVQETLARAYRGFPRFQQGSNFGAWVYKILVNTYINGYRKDQRRPVQYPSADITTLQHTGDAQHSSVALRSAEDEVLETLPDNDVKSAMQVLPLQFRLAIYYADVEGFRFREIAEITDVPIGTVMSRLHRGRRRLRQLLADAANKRGYLAAGEM